MSKKKEIKYKRASVMYNNVECPVCGNGIIVASSPELQKCKWCRRPIKITVEKSGRKYFFKAEETDFPEEKVHWSYTDRFC